MPSAIPSPSATATNTASPKPADSPVREAFQKFVAGTFYKQMLKSLRKMHDRPAYFHGGQAEEMFRSRMDQQVAENLAETQGDALAGPLYHAFAQQLRLSVQPQADAS